jgi:hypothetical protein
MGLLLFSERLITRNVDLSQVVATQFEVQEIRFVGMGPCKPCHWTVHAFHTATKRAVQP